MFKTGKHRIAGQGQSHVMKSILYLPSTDPLSDQIESLVRGLDGQNQTEVYRTVDTFELRLRSSGERIDIVVLSVPELETLENLLNIADLLRDIPLVAIIPDNSEETVAMVHELRPRYLHSNKNHLAGLGSVLKNMVGARLRREIQPAGQSS
jgi:hypothetical protein